MPAHGWMDQGGKERKLTIFKDYKVYTPVTIIIYENRRLFIEQCPAFGLVHRKWPLALYSPESLFPPGLLRWRRSVRSGAAWPVQWLARY